MSAPESRSTAKETLRSFCKAGGELGCSCADQNYQWFGPECKERMAAAFKHMLSAAQARQWPKEIRGLVNEIAGIWDAFELGIRQEISNTNYVVVREKLSAVESLLAAPQPVDPAYAEPNLGKVGVENLADWFYNEGHEFVVSDEEEVARALLDQFDISPRRALVVPSTEGK